MCLSLSSCLSVSCASIPGLTLLETRPGRQHPGAGVLLRLVLLPLCPRAQPSLLGLLLAPGEQAGADGFPWGPCLPQVPLLWTRDRPREVFLRQAAPESSAGPQFPLTGPGWWEPSCSMGLRHRGVQRPHWPPEPGFSAGGSGDRSDAIIA